MLLRVETMPEDNAAVIAISGRVSAGKESGRIEPSVLASISGGAKRIIIDMADVSHIDSTGIGILAICFAKASQAGAVLGIAGARRPVYEVFRITRLDEVVPFFPSVAAALKRHGGLN